MERNSEEEKIFNESVWFLYGQTLDTLAEGNTLTKEHIKEIAEESMKRYAKYYTNKELKKMGYYIGIAYFSFMKWLLQNKQSVFIESDISMWEKKEILNQHGYSSEMLY